MVTEVEPLVLFLSGQQIEKDDWKLTMSQLKKKVWEKAWKRVLMNPLASPL